MGVAGPVWSEAAVVCGARMPAWRSKGEQLVLQACLGQHLVLMWHLSSP
jgi:hypothetical protein